MIARIATAGTSFSRLPCKAWHGYMITNAHHVEVGAGGPTSAPPSCGRLLMRLLTQLHVAANISANGYIENILEIRN
jgi:hypothetical protein